MRVESWGAEARVAVRDQGPGIPVEVLPRLFERLYRGVSAADGPPGHGLGLYLSKSLVEAHGGCLWAESTPGLGSTFIVELPRAAPAWPAPTARPSPPGEADAQERMDRERGADLESISVAAEPDRRDRAHHQRGDQRRGAE